VALTIDSEELQKPSGTKCQHCDIGIGCKIYLSRPPVCRDWHCGWRLLEFLDEGWRPDKSKVLISVSSDENKNIELTLELIDALTVVLQPSFLGLVAGMVAENVKMYLLVPGKPGHVAAKVFLNDGLAGAIKNGDVEQLAQLMVAALGGAVDHLKSRHDEVVVLQHSTPKE